MRAPSIRTRLIAARASAPVAILLAGLMVWQGSEAAFTAETHNSGNNWDAGSIHISDDDDGGAMFQVAELTPGDTGVKCIVVTADSTVTGVIRTYVSSMTAEGLQDYIDITIEQGSGGSFANCADPTPFSASVTHAAQAVSGLRTDHGTYGTGILPWTKGTGEQSMTYRFTWVFDTTGLTETEVNALQTKSVGANFEWELQND